MIGALLHPHTLTVVQVTTGPPDADGVPARTEVLKAWGPASVQLVGTSESTPPTEQITERWRASGPLAEWIEPGDRVVWDGATYDIDGTPAHFTAGILDHTELVLIRWRG